MILISILLLFTQNSCAYFLKVPEFESDAEIPTLIQILDCNWYGAEESFRPIIVPGTE